MAKQIPYSGGREGQGGRLYTEGICYGVGNRSSGAHRIFLFFFSSRRRHTRLVSDWSSDMCSSDRSEEHTSELQSLTNFVCRLLLGVQTCALPIHRERRRLYVSH